MARSLGSEARTEELSESIPAPLAPGSLEETGLDGQFLLRFILKAIYVTNRDTASGLADYVALPEVVVQEILDSAKEKRLVEVLGLVDARRSLYRYALTSTGREWAIDALQQCQYTGPAPVPLDAYRAQVGRQAITRDQITPDSMGRALSHLVLPEGTVGRLGPAANSAKAILLHGAPGNGKTSVALALGAAFHQSIHVPHCIEVDGQIIRIFDPSVHGTADAATGEARAELDARWVRCRRPVIVAGGELTIEMLDLSFDPISKFYEAPAHVKATGGVFIIDDLGRQRVRALDLVNRWILPLERGIDFLTLHTGKKVEMPFDELVIFSTNFPPADLIDEAGMRRIPYKFHVSVPTRKQYEAILHKVCQEKGIALPDDVLPYLLDTFYPATGVPISAAHPKFVLEHALERCRFQGIAAQLNLALVHDAVENLIVEGEAPAVPPQLVRQAP